MKKITFIFGLALLLGLFALNNTANAQAVVIQDEVAYLGTYDDVYESYYHQIVVTPSGNIKYKAKFWIDLDDSMVPEKGVAKYAFYINWFYEGQFYYLQDVNTLFLANGNCILEYNWNPAGNINP